MSNICDFDKFWKLRILNATCKISPETAELRIWMTLKEMRQTRRAGLLNVKSRTFKCEGERNDHMLHYEQVFGNVFERRESKCCAVLMKYCCKVKGEQVITLQLVQELKTKNINVVPGKLFCRQCKAKLLLETDSLYWWSRQISICYRYWKWIYRMLNTKEKTPISWHFNCQLTRVFNFKEQYFGSIQSTSWLFEGFKLWILG